MIALLATSFIALWPIAIFVSRLGGDPSSYTYGTSRVVEVCAAWLLYAACAYVNHKASTGRAIVGTRGIKRRPIELDQ